MTRVTLFIQDGVIVRAHETLDDGRTTVLRLHPDLADLVETLNNMPVGGKP